jgi:catechol 2,3-dioxygenase-like lactoylglutathione lyase family enzyme
MYLGIRSVIYPAPDITAARDWFAGVLGIQPYFDEPFYVGFNLGGYELGLDPGADVAKGAISYWGVESVSETLEELLAAGASDSSGVVDVGDGLRMATVRLPGGVGIFGIIENPAFVLAPVGSRGPGQ